MYVFLFWAWVYWNIYFREMNLFKSYNYIKDNLDLINNINIFPVYDKDTGNNVLYTLENIKDIEITKENLPNISEKILYNARGNSGNILALFFIGLSQNKYKNLHDMCKNAAEFTWNNMYNPQHGTILDALSNVPENSDIENFLFNYYNNSLDELILGKNKLNILNDYDTVDAGTLCFIYIIKGLYESICNRTIEFNIELNPINININKSKYRYCLNFNIKNDIIIPNDIDIDSLIHINTESINRFHLHTNDVDQVLNYVNKYGEAFNIYIQDMEKE